MNAPDSADADARAAFRRRAAWTAVVVALIAAVIVVMWPREEEDATHVAASTPTAAVASPPAVAAIAKPVARPRRVREEAPTPSETVADATFPERPKQAPDAPPAADATGVAVTVVDEDGHPAAEGAVSLDVEWNARIDDKSPEAWMRRRALFGESPLPKTGPLVRCFAPQDVDGLEIAASARVPGLPPTAAVKFTMHAKQVVAVRLVVTRPRKAEVRVVDRETEQPIKGATVTSKTERDRREAFRGEFRGSGGLGTGVTDIDGRCTLDGLGAGEHVIKINADGHEHGEATWSDGPLVVGLAPYHGFGRVVVTVLGPDGGPAAGVVVELTLTDRSERTDASGRATFNETPAGSRLFSLGLESAKTGSAPWALRNGVTTMEFVDVAVGGTSELVLGFRQRTSSATVRIALEDGTPVVGADVEVFGTTQFDAKTDRDGIAQFATLPPGKFGPIVRVAPDVSWHFDWFEVGAGSHVERTLTLGTATIRGRVVKDAARTPVAGMSVAAYGPSIAFTATDREGRFTIPSARPGAYQVRADPFAALGFKIVSGFAAHNVAVTVPSDAEVVIEMIESGRIAARFSADDRPRSASARIVALSDDDHADSMFRRATGQDDLITGDLAPGKYQVEVMFENRTAKFPAEVVAGKTTIIDVKLP